MTVTRAQAEAAVQTALAGTPAGVTSLELANRAGRQMMNSRTWRWSQTDQREFDFVVSMGFTSATTDEIAVGATIVGQTSAATGKVSAVRISSGSFAGGDAVGTLYLNTQGGAFQAELIDIQGGATGVANVAGPAVQEEFVLLPEDLLGIVDIDTVPDQANHFRLTSPGQILRLKAVTANSAGPPFWGVVSWTRDPREERPWPRIDIFPPPTGPQEHALNAYVRISWLDFRETSAGGDPSDEAIIPFWLEDLYYRYIAVLARGYEDDLESPNRVDEYLEALQAGATYRAAVKIDSRFQPVLSPPSNGMFGPRQTAWSNVGAVTGP